MPNPVRWGPWGDEIPTYEGVAEYWFDLTLDELAREVPRQRAFEQDRKRFTRIVLSMPVWLLEMFPKDPYYNYGRQILYIDKEHHCAYYKEIYDRAGSYWKCTSVYYSFQFAEDGEDFGMSELYNHVDWKTHHAGFSNIINYPAAPIMPTGNYRLPLSKLGPDHFTKDYLIQISK